MGPPSWTLQSPLPETRGLRRFERGGEVGKGVLEERSVDGVDSITYPFCDNFLLERARPTDSGVRTRPTHATEILVGTPSVVGRPSPRKTGRVCVGTHIRS